MDRVDFTYPTKIIPQQVNDHDVFALVFLVVGEPPSIRILFSNRKSPRSSSFHRSGNDLCATPAKEQLWRGGQDVYAAEVDESSEFDRLNSHEVGEQRGHIGGIEC